MFKTIKNVLLTYDNARKIEGISGLVLDVGSGHNPFPFADVLCDLYIKNNFQRMGYKLQIGKKTLVMCDAQFLPFKDRAFDFVHTSHVLEHVNNPRLMLQELKRVGKRIHIEVPTWLRETFLCADQYHKWIFTRKNGRIFVSKPRKGFKLKLDRIPFFHSFEYLTDKFFHIFILKMNLES